jgi:hypothetical protein
MVTATKKTAPKTVKSKKKVAPATEEQHVEEEVEHEEKETDVIPSKVKKPIEIDEPEADVGVEDKTEVDPLLGSAEEDELSDEVSLDGEEINPFGDRWEE